MTKRKIETILERFERLGLGEGIEDMVGAQGPVQHADPLMLVTWLCLVLSCADTFLALSVESSASFERYWTALEP